MARNRLSCMIWGSVLSMLVAGLYVRSIPLCLLANDATNVQDLALSRSLFVRESTSSFCCRGSRRCQSKQSVFNLSRTRRTTPSLSAHALKHS